MIDPAFGMNSFNTPKFYNESVTTAKNIITILEGRPGFFPSMPDLGMDIKRSLIYKDIDEIDTEAIKVELVRQCDQFITNVRDGTFDVQKMVYQERPLLIFVIPVTIERASQRLAVGVMLNSKGETIYRIEYVSDLDE